jgi:hypothetical protein
MGGKQIWGVNNLEIEDLAEFFDGKNYKKQINVCNSCFGIFTNLGNVDFPFTTTFEGNIW